MPPREHDRERRRRRSEGSPARRPDRARRGGRIGRAERLERQERAERQDHVSRRTAGSGEARSSAARERGLRQRADTPRRPRSGRGRRPAAGAGGAFQLSSTRRAAMIALVACALLLSIAVPLRTYLSQQSEMQQEQQRLEELDGQARELERRKTQLSDTTEMEAEARRRGPYVRPGETPYVVKLPTTPPPAPPAAGSENSKDKNWIGRLWDSITGGGS